MLRGGKPADDWDIDNNGAATAAVSQLDVNDTAMHLAQDSNASESEAESNE